jgi:hypothetical protein
MRDGKMDSHACKVWGADATWRTKVFAIREEILRLTPVSVVHPNHWNRTVTAWAEHWVNVQWPPVEAVFGDELPRVLV